MTTGKVVVLMWFLSNESDLLLAYLGQILSSKVKIIRLNSSQCIRCYNNECASISGLVASGQIQACAETQPLTPTCLWPSLEVRQGFPGVEGGKVLVYAG